MSTRFKCAARVLVMLVLFPALAFAGQREPSDKESGPTGLACKNAATAMRQAKFALSVGEVRLRDGKAFGAWDSVFFYACRNGIFVQRHSRRYYYGARISNDGNGLVITSGEWRDTDPGCCASQERRESFVWDEGTGRVVLRRTQIGEPKKR